ncbi:MAG: FIST signal transduction protein [Acidimicrobiales bacterium]
MAEPTFAAGLSRHPNPATAAGEVVGAVAEQLGGPASVAVLFVAGRHIEAVADLVDTIQTLLTPDVLIGGSAVGVAGGAEEVEDGDAVSLWAASGLTVEPVRLEALGGDPPLVMGLPDSLADGSLLVVIADPATMAIDAFVDQINEGPQRIAVVGGLASASGGADRTRLILDERILLEGAVGFVLPAGAASTFVSQGCRPIGSPWVVTDADGQLVKSLGGKSAMDRLSSVLDGLDASDRAAAARGLHIGVVADEQQTEFGQGDFLIRTLLGAERGTGAIAVGDRVEVGQVLQFQVRDAASASEELDRLLVDAEGRSTLLFTCNGRGSHLFDEPSHDAARVHERVPGPLAGMFCAGEVGPIAGRNAVHGFTLTAVVFA